MPRFPPSLAGVLVLLASLPPALADTPANVIEETVQRHLDRFAACRAEGIATITDCYKGWAAGDSVTEAMVKCIGADLVPKTINKEQRTCIWVDVSTEEDAEELGAF